MNLYYEPGTPNNYDCNFEKTLNNMLFVTEKLLTYVADENREPGAVFVTGAGDFGQLGLGPDVTLKKRPALVNIEHEKFVSISAGAMHTVCLTSNGEVTLLFDSTCHKSSLTWFNFNHGLAFY